MLIIDALVGLITFFIILYIIVFIKHVIESYKNYKTKKSSDNNDPQSDDDDDLNNPPRRPPPPPRLPPTIVWTVNSTLNKENVYTFYDYSKFKAILIEDLVDDI